MKEEWEGDIFSGVTSFFEGKDTVGAIFFVLGRTVTVIQYVISIQGLVLD